MLFDIDKTTINKPTNKRMNASIIKSQQKMQKYEANLSKMRSQYEEMHLKIENEERKLNEERVKYAAMRRHLIEKNVEKTAKQEQAQQKARELKAKRDIKNYWSSEEQVWALSLFDDESLIRMTNSSDPEIAISLENLFRIHGHRLQELYPNGWTVPTFKSTFRRQFAALDWLQKMNCPDNSISSVFYRMCPESETSVSKTGRLTAIPSFTKVENNTTKYIFDANLCLRYC